MLIQRTRNRTRDRVDTLLRQPVAVPPPPVQRGQHIERREERWGAFKFGKILFSDREELACILQDMSEHGLRIKFYGRPELPPRVIVAIPELRYRKTLDVRWQNGEEAGLSVV